MRQLVSGARGFLQSPRIYVLLARCAQLVGQLLLVLAIPKALEPALYVHFALVLPLGLLGAHIVFGWLARATYRNVYEVLDPDTSRASDTTVVFTGAAIIVALALFALLVWLSDSQYAVVPLLILAIGIRTFILGLVNASEKHRAFFWAHAAFATAVLVLAIMGTRIDSPAELISIFTVYALIELAVSGVFWILISVHPLSTSMRFHTAIGKRYMTFGIPLVLHNIGVWVVSLSDRYLLTIWESDETVASYILTYQLASSVVMVPVTFSMMLVYPNALRLEKEVGLEAAEAFVRTAMKRYLRWAPILGVAGFFSVWVAMTHLFDNYQTWPTIIAIVVVAHLLLGLTPFQNKEFELRLAPRTITISIGLGAATNVFLNLGLLPLMGVLGAALSTLLAYAVAVMYLRRKSCWSDAVLPRE
ncbi:MAG: hypothetical protein AAF493_09245 [Pseudomonadota bacterium]